MKNISLKQLLGAGAHFGHQVNKWNPKMKPYLYTAREGVHIFDLVKTKEGLEAAGKYLKEVADKKGIILWVGTKRQAQNFVREMAVQLGDSFITQRWIGGLLTNYEQVKKSIDRLSDLKEKKQSGAYGHYTKKENLLIDRDIAKLTRFFGGLTGMTKIPDVVVVVDTHREDAAVREAKRMKIPVVGIIDSNADPEMVTYGIPANDDAVKSLELIINFLGETEAEGKNLKVKRVEAPELPGVNLKAKDEEVKPQPAEVATEPEVEKTEPEKRGRKHGQATGNKARSSAKVKKA